MTPLLSVDDLHIHFTSQGRELHAVRGVNWSLNPGETLGIVGESGCGKSAMAKAILQLNPPYTTRFSGKIAYEGCDLLQLPEKKIQAYRGKEISMIFQDPMTSLNPTMTIGKQIVEGYVRHFPNASKKQAKEKALEMLEHVGIANAEERFFAYPHTFSGGMRQRAMIALALACQPKILLADEPTTALDVTIQIQILDLLKSIQKKMGTSILLITHDLSVVARTCDRVLVMYAGKVVESASVDALFSSPQHPYTRRLLKAIPRLDANRLQALEPIEGTPPTLSRSIAGCAFCPRCHEAMQICKNEDPPLFSRGEEHKSACFLYDPRRRSGTPD